METSTCSTCKRTLPLSDFYWQKDKGRPHAWCKECYRDWHLQRYTPKVPISDHPQCVVCGKDYTPKHRRPTKFCSQYCRNRSRIQTERELRKLHTEQKKCAWCGTGFVFTPGRKGRVLFCSDKCQQDAGNARKTPEQRAAYRFMAKYGITLEKRDSVLAKQGGCAICKTSTPGPKGWAMDHDHTCCPDTRRDSKTCGTCIRGILCSRCNLAIGLFDDDPQRLRAAAKYLSKHIKS